MDREDIRLWRIMYIKKLRAIIYMNETQINSDHHLRKGRSDDSPDWGSSNTGIEGTKDYHCAGFEEGFAPDSLLIFRPETKTEDYHDNMNTENYKKYVTEILIPNLLRRSVVVVDNAS